VEWQIKAVEAPGFGSEESKRADPGQGRSAHPQAGPARDFISTIRISFFGGNSMQRISGSLRMAFTLGLAVFGAGMGSASAGEAALTMSRQLLLKKAVPAPADTVETRVIRVQFPSGYKTPLHTHEGPGPRYVLKGRLRVEDAGERHVYGPGDVFWETGAAMTVENIGGGDAEMVIFELAPAGAAKKP
jgi:quercetin dioxygenase-like cupin family protein